MARDGAEAIANMVGFVPADFAHTMVHPNQGYNTGQLVFPRGAIAPDYPSRTPLHATVVATPHVGILINSVVNHDNRKRVAREARVSTRLVCDLEHGQSDSPAEVLGRIYKAATRGGELCLALYDVDELFERRVRLNLLLGHGAAPVIGRYLAQRRVQQELTQIQVADKLGWPVERVSRYERGYSKTANGSRLQPSRLKEHLALFGKAIGYCGLPPVASPALGVPTALQHMDLVSQPSSR